MVECSAGTVGFITERCAGGEGRGNESAGWPSRRGAAVGPEVEQEGIVLFLRREKTVRVLDERERAPQTIRARRREPDHHGLRRGCEQRALRGPARGNRAIREHTRAVQLARAVCALVRVATVTPDHVGTAGLVGSRLCVLE